MLAGIYYGAMYGGSITSILLRLPGDASSAVTVVEGYPMAQQGRAGTALVMTTVASFFGACVAIVCVATLAPPLARAGAELPVAGVFLADAGRPDRGLGAGARLAAEGPRHGGARPDHRRDRPGQEHRLPALHLRARRALRGRQFRRDGGRAVRARRDHPQRRPRREAQGLYRARAAARARALARRPQGLVLADGARLRPRRADRHPAGRGSGDLVVHGLCHGEADRARPLALRQGRDRGPGGARGRQQCRRPDRLHPDADARRAGRRHHRHHPGRPDHPRHHAGARRSSPRRRSCSGACWRASGSAT